MAKAPASGDAKKPGQAKSLGCLYRALGWVLAIAGVVCLANWKDELKRELTGRSSGNEAWILGAAGWISLGLGGWFLVRGKRHQAESAGDILEKDKRPPVLYLRSFEHEGAASRTVKGFGLPMSSVTEEEQLAEVMTEFGPFVAVGKPGEKLPTLGAARMYLRDDEWQGKVAGLMSNAALVAIRSGLTEGFWWEFRRCAKYLYPERLVVLVAYSGREYEAFREQMLRHTRIVLPPEPRGGARAGSLRGLIWFEADWTGHFETFSRSLLRSSASAPLVGMFKRALRPVYAQLGVHWAKPSISIWRAYLTFMFTLALLGLILLAILLLTGVIQPD